MVQVEVVLIGRFESYLGVPLPSLVSARRYLLHFELLHVEIYRHHLTFSRAFVRFFATTEQIEFSHINVLKESENHRSVLLL